MINRHRIYGAAAIALGLVALPGRFRRSLAAVSAGNAFLCFLAYAAALLQCGAGRRAAMGGGRPRSGRCFSPRLTRFRLLWRAASSSHRNLRNLVRTAEQIAPPSVGSPSTSASGEDERLSARISWMCRWPSGSASSLRRCHFLYVTETAAMVRPGFRPGRDSGAVTGAAHSACPGSPLLPASGR